MSFACNGELREIKVDEDALLVGDVPSKYFTVKIKLIRRSR